MPFDGFALTAMVLIGLWLSIRPRDNNAIQQGEQMESKIKKKSYTSTYVYGIRFEGSYVIGEIVGRDYYIGQTSDIDDGDDDDRPRGMIEWAMGIEVEITKAKTYNWTLITFAGYLTDLIPVEGEGE